MSFFPLTSSLVSELNSGMFYIGSQAKEQTNYAPAVPAGSNVAADVPPVPVKKKIGINEPQICKNKGCGKTFKEKDNHETACSYHPGPAVFHDRMRGVRFLSKCVVLPFILSNLFFIAFGIDANLCV